MEPMEITIKYFSRISEITGKQAETITLDPDSTLADLADHLQNSYGITLQNKNIMTLLNGKGRHLYPEQFSTPLSSGDSVALLPPITGG